MLYAGPQPDVILLTFAIAYLPSLILLVLVRYMEKYEREPWGAMGTAFLWGATATVVLVILARGYFKVYMRDNYPEISSNKDEMIFYTSCLITPIAAELVKLMSLFFVREELDEAEDGLIYGAVAGLGFAATEMLLYGLFVFSSYGIKVFIYTVLLRTVSVVILQGSVGAIAGYGITRAVAKKHKKGSLWLSPVFLIIAMACHGLFNWIAQSTTSQGGFDVSHTYALGFAIAFSGVTWILIWIKIFRLDRIDAKPKEEKKEDKGAAGKFAFDRGGGRPPSRDAGRDYGRGHPDRRFMAGDDDEGYEDDYDDEDYDDEDYDDEDYDDDYDGDYDDEDYDDEDYDDEDYDGDYDDEEGYEDEDYD